MKNYKNSDYAVNKYSDGIVYRFSDGAHELTLEEFLASDPSLTEQDFRRWKRYSRIGYYTQARDENAQTKKNRPIKSMGHVADSTEISIEEAYGDNCDTEYAKEALEWILENDILTAVQYRRFILHFVEGCSLRKIAAMEDVFFTSVAESINAAVMKLKKHFPNF